VKQHTILLKNYKYANNELSAIRKQSVLWGTMSSQGIERSDQKRALFIEIRGKHMSLSEVANHPESKQSTSDSQNGLDRALAQTMRQKVPRRSVV
jgi:hypothetical protein